jgi:soluble cytochrome b562/3D (Asp-Asp-Asp) domain-containing protein
MKTNNFIMTLIMALYVMIVLLTTLLNKAYDEMDNKLDAIASQTDATAEKVNNLESDFKTYRTGMKEIIDSLCEQLKIHKEDMQNEIERIDDDVENVRISKANKKKTYTASTATYYQPTDGLTKSSGVNYYGEQKETYYNLNMSRVVNNAQNAGLEGDYWVREDGAKMFGDYVIVAANQDVHPYGSTVETSIGTGIVLDTGGFASGNPTQVDIATDW